MSFQTKVDSNVTGLRFCEEVTIGVLPDASDQIWYPMEPNSYSNWGAQTKLTQRAPITDTRQKRKGVLTDLDAAGSLNMDMTLTNYQRLMQGFMFADFREKFDTESFNGTNTDVSAVAAPSTIKLDNGSQLGDLYVHALILTTGSAHAENNGLFHVTSIANVAASQVLTSSANYADGETVTIGTRVYTFEGTLTAGDGHVHIGATEADTIANLHHAINNSGGTPGTDYNVDAADPLVTAVDNASHTVTVTAIVTGYVGNSIATTETSATASWGAATLTGGQADIVITETSLVNEASPPAAMRVEAVGVQFASGDLTYTNSGTSYPVLATTVFDLETLGLIPGEFVYIGGDATNSSFATDGDNGFARVRSIDHHAVVLDKTSGDSATDNGSGKTVQVFFGRVVKNEANHDGPNNSIPIKRRTYQFERTLGSPDLSNPTGVQAEYLVGSVAHTFKMDLKTADKVTSDLAFLSLRNDLRTTDEGPKSKDSGATAPDLVVEDAFNTTSHIARLRLAALSDTDAHPSALVGFVSDFNFTIDNMLKANKALAVLGAFEVTAGHFSVSGSMKAYFSTVEAQHEVKQNGNITFDIAFVEANKGVLCDMPLIALSDGRPDVVSDEAIMIPLNADLAPDPTFNHELLWVFFNYLPDVAQPVV
jgi:hypothetical protein